MVALRPAVAHASRRTWCRRWWPRARCWRPSSASTSARTRWPASRAKWPPTSAKACSSLAGLEGSVSADEAPVLKLINSIFESAVTRGVSDIHIEPQERTLQIRFRIDGVMQVQSTPDPRVAAALVQRLKLMSSLDIAEKRLPQDGRFRVKVGTTTLDVRISTLPTQFGESVVMRLLVQDTGRMKLGRDRHARRRSSSGCAPRCMRLVGHGPGHRAHRQRQDHHAVRRAGGAEHARGEDHHGRGPGRVPPAGLEPGAGQRQDRAHVRARAALVPAPGPGRDPGRRDARQRNRRDRPARRAHRPPGALHAAHQRAPPARRCACVDMGVAPYMVALGAAPGDRAAPGAHDLRAMPRRGRTGCARTRVAGRHRRRQTTARSTAPAATPATKPATWAAPPSTRWWR